MEYKEESIFNMALAYLKRIDKLLYICDMASMSRDIEKWNNTLNAVYRELCIRMNSEEREEIEGIDINIIDKNKDDKLDNKEIQIINNLKREHANFKNINFLCNNQAYLYKYRKHILFLLSELEIKLRIKMQEKGMLLPSKDDPRRAIISN